MQPPPNEPPNAPKLVSTKDAGTTTPKASPGPAAPAQAPANPPAPAPTGGELLPDPPPKPMAYPPLQPDALTLSEGALEGWTDDALKKLREHVERVERLRAKIKATEELGAAIEAACAKARAAGIDHKTIDERLAANMFKPPEKPKDGRSRVRMKFWNPKDHSQRWSSRGKPKKWYLDHLAAGGKVEDMLIPESDR